MNSVFYDIIDKYVLVYFDDILVCNYNAIQHEGCLRSVL